MDPRDYAGMRRDALVRAAVERGVAEEEAPAVVDRVLAQQQRHIRRSDDPDPLVQAALAEEVRRRAPTPAASRWPAVAAVLVVVLAAGVAAVALRPERPPVDHLREDQVPSLFGYDAGAARQLLTERGLDVTVTPYRACEVLGRAVGADPATGTTVESGDPVTVYASIPASVTCLTDYADRARAWRFLDFLAGRAAAPPFGPQVLVDVDGRTTQLAGSRATERAAWRSAGAADVLDQALDAVELTDEHPVTYALPTLRVVHLEDRRGPCGPAAPVAADAAATSFVLRAPDGTDCLARVDLVRADPDPTAPIEAVLIRSGS